MAAWHEVLNASGNISLKKEKVQLQVTGLIKVIVRIRTEKNLCTFQHASNILLRGTKNIMLRNSCVVIH